MKRITERSKSGDMLTVKCRNCERTEIGSCEDCQNAIYHRLADIEDILGDEYDLDRLRELVEADRAGRCVVLRCKEGETIYVVGSKKIVKAQIQEMYLLEMTKDVAYMVFFDCDDDCQGCPFNSWYQSYDGEWSCDGEYGNGTVNQSEIGKTVFLTREAAEAALKQKNE